MTISANNRDRKLKKITVEEWDARRPAPKLKRLIDPESMRMFDEAVARNEQETDYTPEEKAHLLGQESGSSSLPLLKMIAAHETKGEKDPWIRTRFKPRRGSTAFGPAQITGSTLKGLVGKTSRPETLKALLDQADKFSKYGGGDWKKLGVSKEEALPFEYGGTGVGLAEEQKEDYWVIAQEVLAQKAREIGISSDPAAWGEEDERRLIEAWHGGGEDISKSDYTDKVLRNEP